MSLIWLSMAIRQSSLTWMVNKSTCLVKGTMQTLTMHDFESWPEPSPGPCKHRFQIMMDTEPHLQRHGLVHHPQILVAKHLDFQRRV